MLQVLNISMRNSTNSKKITLFTIICILFFLSFNINLYNAKAQEKEYLIKASYIEKFARFTDWYPPINSKEFSIVVLGKNPFGNSLEVVSSKNKIKNLDVKIRYAKNIQDVGNAQIVFVSRSEKANLSAILEYTQSKNILTIGDTEGYAEQGVHFNFYFTSDGNIRFEVNKKSIKSDNFKVNVSLLSLAKIIGD